MSQPTDKHESSRSAGRRRSIIIMVVVGVVFVGIVVAMLVWATNELDNTDIPTDAHYSALTVQERL